MTRFPLESNADSHADSPAPPLALVDKATSAAGFAYQNRLKAFPAQLFKLPSA
jgi:hypothetical protein